MTSPTRLRCCFLLSLLFMIPLSALIIVLALLFPANLQILLSVLSLVRRHSVSVVLLPLFLCLATPLSVVIIVLALFFPCKSPDFAFGTFFGTSVLSLCCSPSTFYLSYDTALCAHNSTGALFTCEPPDFAVGAFFSTPLLCLRCSPSTFSLSCDTVQPALGLSFLEVAGDVPRKRPHSLASVSLVILRHMFSLASYSFSFLSIFFSVPLLFDYFFIIF